jgi:uncharacterized membrane protein required for colicin V production
MEMIADGAILLVLLIFAVRSYRGGLPGEINGATGWILAILLAFGLTNVIAAVINQFFKSGDLTTISRYLAFLLILISVRAISAWIVRVFPDDGVGKRGFFITALTVCCGLFKGAFFTSVVLLMLSTSSLQNKVDAYTPGALLYPHMRNFSRTVVKAVTRYIPNVDNVMRKLTTRPAQIKNSDVPE